MVVPLMRSATSSREYVGPPHTTLWNGWPHSWPESEPLETGEELLELRRMLHVSTSDEASGEASVLSPESFSKLATSWSLTGPVFTTTASLNKPISRIVQDHTRIWDSRTSVCPRRARRVLVGELVAGEEVKIQSARCGLGPGTFFEPRSCQMRNGAIGDIH